MGFKKATKSQSKLRLAIFGASGSGKTYSALRIAKGIGGNIAVIDSERGSASKYSDRFEFDVVDLESKNIDEYVQWIEEANGKYSVLVIDSLTHAWTELLEEIDRIARTKYSGNSWSAWNEGTPKQKKLINSILSFNGHIIATMRAKTEWIVEQNTKGKNVPKRVGTAPEQGKGIEYEFDLLMDISVEHVAQVIKDRTGKFQDKLIELPDESFGKQLSDWLQDGEKVKDYSDEINKCETLDQLTKLWDKMTDAEKTLHKAQFSKIKTNIQNEKKKVA